jgi:hypothetical protein
MKAMTGRCERCGGELAVGADGREGGCVHCGEGVDIPPEGVLLSVDIRFRCPCCAKKIAVEARHEGARAACPRCNAALRIPRFERGAGAGADTPANLLTESEIEVLLGTGPSGA